MNSSEVERRPVLSKSRFLAGLQCSRRLYLECFHPDLADPMPPAEQAKLDMGTRVGELARDLFPGATLIDDPYFRHEDAIAKTVSALSDRSALAICEGAFLHDDVSIRVDILARAANGGLDLIKFKFNSSAKDDRQYRGCAGYLYPLF